MAAKETEKQPSTNDEHKPPRGSSTTHKHKIQGRLKEYTATADWLILRKKEKPKAEMFHVAYSLKGVKSSTRPITFVFNGGPGASSAYLHVGALGPKRVVFNEDGTPLAPPAQLTENSESWLPFTDLVFVDPIGTGFSRTIEEKASKPEPEGAKEKENKEYYQLKRDLESLGEFIQKYLSKNKRWDSPVYIAGESYGGFRVGKLARLLQEGYGVGLNGAILISPALEWVLLSPSDYDVLHWVDLFPTMALAAKHHGKSRVKAKSVSLFKSQAEQFAMNELALVLVQGDFCSEKTRKSVYKKMADFLGLTEDYVTQKAGRIPFWVFCRELLRPSREVCGFYDATVKAVDPFPDRPLHEAPDPTLYAIERVFSGGINTQLRHNLKLESERDYNLLSMEVHQSWQVDTQTHAFERQVGATDDLRYAMSLNPKMKVFITHGLFDLVTPYFSSDRLVQHMKLTTDQRKNLTLKHFMGGHMFYAWKKSRIEFLQSIQKWYADTFCD